MSYLNCRAVWGITLAAALLAGCVSEKQREAALARIGDEVPPDFLVSPVALALTNFDGFSADVVSTNSSASGLATAAGELLERQGRLIFQPLTTAHVKKGRIVRGGMFFIWDTAGSHSFVVSEALQGCAPLAAAVQITNISPEIKEPAVETVNDHACHRFFKMVALNDGSTVKLTEWRADDLKWFPVRVRAESGGHIISVEFSNIRLAPPPPELFVPQEGFTRYANSTALINELMIRESSLKKGPTSESAPGEKPAGWRQPGVGVQ